MSEPLCPIHNVPLDFYGYIPAPGSDMPGEDWRCPSCVGSLREKLNPVPAGQWLMIGNTTPAQHLMTGIERAGIRSDGLLQVLYVDGTEKSKACPERLLDGPADALTLFAVASEFSTEDEQEDSPEWPENHGGDSPSYRRQMQDAGRGHLLH